ncbi:NADP-dependent oxidoreductase [Consotaella aegiceratis]|uniref:NADP-dependent oxidoreductase n=1 Tax=Consotaella aegiceratis TaxID=3097961 RepID=UPI002F40C9EF
MRAVQFAEYGGPDVLRVVETDEPHAGPGEIRISVRAAGVNALDWKIRKGQMRDFIALDLPAGTGRDAAGVVDEVGEGVGGIAVGNAVFGSGSATFAEKAVLKSWALKPEGLSFEEAAGYPVPAETAKRILDQLDVRSGETLLISGAAGGVGSAAVQFARDRGLTIIGTASERNQDYLRSIGAIATTYGEGWVERVREIAPEGVDAALDIAGAGVIEALISLTGEPSKVLSIADFSAPKYGAQVSSTAKDAPAAFALAARLYEEGAFRLPVERTFSLYQAAAAQKESAEGHVRGRLVIVIE